MTTSKKSKTHDTQIIELMGRNKLVNALLEAGLEVARPERDRGIDMIVYLDIAKNKTFVARPIQMKAASRKSFGLDEKYKRINALLLVYVWHTHGGKDLEIYVLTYKEAFSVAKKMGYTETEFWRQKRRYSTSSPSQRLCELLEEYKMTSQKWKEKITNL